MTDFGSLIASLLNPFFSEILGVVVSLTIALLLFAFRPRVRLLWGRLSASLNKVEVPPVNDAAPEAVEFFVEKFLFQNTGSKTANNLQVVLARKPVDVNVSPARANAQVELPKGEYQIDIRTLAPQEFVSIDCFYANQLASPIVTVRCDETVGKLVSFMPARQMPQWFYRSVWVFVFLGVAFVAQILAMLLSN